MKRLVLSFALCAGVFSEDAHASTIKYDALSREDHCKIIKLQIESDVEQGNKPSKQFVSEYIKFCNPTFLMS